MYTINLKLYFQSIQLQGKANTDPCPGPECPGGCCPVSGWICCQNPDFCAPDEADCPDIRTTEVLTRIDDGQCPGRHCSKGCCQKPGWVCCENPDYCAVTPDKCPAPAPTNLHSEL